MKALDTRNVTARQKQLKAENPQPYHKLYIDTERACPFCDTNLRRSEDRQYFTMECDCSYWDQEGHPRSFAWTREPKPDTIKPTKLNS